MNTDLVTVVESLRKNSITPFLSGSFALCAYAGKPLGDPQDIDLLFRSREEHDRAVSLLEDNLHYKQRKQITWESDLGTESVNTQLTSPGGIDFDLACTVGDIQLSLDPSKTVNINQRPIPILSVGDIRKSYLRFFNEKTDAQQKLDLIKKISPDE